jgi:integrase
MQAHRRAQVSVALSATYKGKPRSKPVWVMRYRLPSGKDSKKVIGLAWRKKGRPPHGFLTEADALLEAEAFAAEHSADAPDARRRFRAALDAFLSRCTREKGLRGSTLHEYKKIGERLASRPWRGELAWADRSLDAFTGADLLAVRRELADAKRSANTLNHYRRVVRGIFGTSPSSPALAWAWTPQKVESEGKLQFYTPEQVRRLIAKAHSPLDKALYILATEAGPRLSEIRGLKVANVDFEVGVLRFEDGFTTSGGHAGNKGRRVRSVPMTANVRTALWAYCQGKAGGMLVFEHDVRPGEPICGTGAYRRFVSAAKRAGLPRLRFHDLRHTFGTQAIRVFKVHEVQRMMGHRHITTTERYLHYSPDPDAAAKLTALWAGGALEPTENVVPLRRSA